LMVTFLMFLVGLVSLVYWMFNKKNKDEKETIGLLIFFSLSLALWSLIETQIPTALFGMPLLLNQLAFLFNKMMGLSAMMFFASIFALRNSRVMRIVIWGLIADFWISLILQVVGIADFMTTAIINTAFLGLGALLVVYTSAIMLIRSHKQSKQVRLTMWIQAGLLCVATLFSLLNTVLAYGAYVIDASRYTRVGLLIYSIGMAVMTMNNSVKLMREGRQAQAIRIEAETDTMTKLKNRTSFDKDLASIGASDFERYGIVMCDLNNLKHVNDSYGHSMGDYYIITGAGFIKGAYGKYGTVYRIGGDEFCAIVQDLDEGMAEQLRDTLKSRDINLQGPYADYSTEMGVAAGYAKFDASQDKDLSDTIKRADSIMYEHKKEMKHRGNP